jgi:hypothetical protein
MVKSGTATATSDVSTAGRFLLGGEAEQRVKQPAAPVEAKRAEEVGKVDAPSKVRRGVPGRASEAACVIVCQVPGIGQHSVGLGDHLAARFGVRFFAAIRMVFWGPAGGTPL